MLSVFFDWVYILFTTMTIGGLCARLIMRKTGYRIHDLTGITGLGLMAVTVYAQVFSLFYKVGLVANLLLLLVCMAGIVFCLFVDKKSWKEKIGFYIRQETKGKWIAVGILFVLWIYFTSKGIMHYDSDLYHAQSIRWIEEYGVVKGLGNLQVRFAYNSSVFALSALYSMKFLTGHSLHSISGFFAFLLSVKVLDLKNAWKEKHFRLSDFVRLSAFYYLTLISDEVVAPASDYAIMCTVFYLVLTWISLLEEKEKRVEPYALLCVGGTFAVTLKLTAGVILLLAIRPAKQLIAEKRWKSIGVYLLAGVLTVLPWMARTVVISGYLLYPFPALDIFSFDWKLPAQKAMMDAAEIKVWGRALYDVSLLHEGITQWFGNWFRTVLTGTEKVIILVDFLSVLLLLAETVMNIGKKEKREWLLPMWAVAASYLFWQFSAPLPRYGYAYMLLMTALPWGYFLTQIQANMTLVSKGLCWLGLLFVAAKLILIGKYAVTLRNQMYLVWQQPYGTYQVQSCEIQGETFYYPVEGDRVGYDAFPSSTAKPEILFRGETIKDGFLGARIQE